MSPNSWTEQLGEDFSRSFTFDTAGVYEIQVSARNTELDTDPGTHNLSETYSVNVIDDTTIPSDPLGEIVISQSLPDFAQINESYTIAGNCENANHFKLYVNDVLLSTHQGSNFSELITLSKFNKSEIKIVAVSDVDETDPSTELKEVTRYIVVENPIKTIELDSNKIIVSVTDYLNTRLKLYRIADGSLLLDKPTGIDVEFSLPNQNEEYRIILWDNDVEIDGVNFTNEVPDINLNTISHDRIILQQY